MFRIQRGVQLAILLAAAAVAWPALAADEKPSPAAKPPALQLKQKAAEEKVDPFAVPDGTPKELVDYITKLITSPPAGDADAVKKLRKAVLQAAEKIMAGKPNAEEMEFGVQAKMNMLEKPERLADFAAELEKGGHKDLARQVRGFMLQIALRSSLMGGPEKVKKAINDTVKFLEESPPQPADVGLAFMAGRLAEMSGDSTLAVNTYGSLAKVFAASKDPKLAEFASVLEGVTRRLGLVGQTMKIEGKLLGGAKFDWSKYLGKVVLVDFWATWCDPCLKELPNLQQCYDLYHDKGFDIVGLSLDRKQSDLEDFVKEKKIPWAVVFGDGKPSPTAAYYGVLGIPTMILVGKDGKVVSLEARGETLQEELEKILGPVKAKKDEKDKKAAAAKS
jgi:thiol-disulfide isomerase/thioredoxin